MTAPVQTGAPPLMAHEHCPHCGGELPARPVTVNNVNVVNVGADGQPLPPEEVALRARAMASLLEDRTGWPLRRGRREL